MLDPLVVAFVAVAVTGAVRRARVLLAARAAR
jgi:hypothetical protein